LINNILLIVKISYKFRKKIGLTADKNILILKLRNYLKHKYLNSKTEKLVVNKKKSIINKENLILCPIGYGGLTNQLNVIVKYFTSNNIKFNITWHAKPQIDSELNPFFIDYKNAQLIKYKTVFYFERFPIFWKEACNIFYINIDQLSKTDLHYSRIYADYILYPIDYRSDLFSKIYKNKYFINLKWYYENNKSDLDKIGLSDEKIRILYIGKNTHISDRKNLDKVISAVSKIKDSKYSFTIKLINDLDVFNYLKIKFNKNVEVITSYLSDDEIKNLYMNADICLLPNSSEGNGLTILESLQFECVPIVINGEPMKTILKKDIAYFINYESKKRKKYAFHYDIHFSEIVKTIKSIDKSEVSKKIQNIKKINFSKLQKEFEHTLEDLIIHCTKNKKFEIKDILTTRKSNFFKFKNVRNIYLVMSTYKRFEFFKKTFEQLFSLIRRSNDNFYIDIYIDPDDKTKKLYFDYLSNLNVSMTYNHQKLGLPLLMNMIKTKIKNLELKSHVSFDYVCYFQDDLIINKECLFDNFINIYENHINQNKVLFLTGFGNEIHPGFAHTKINKEKVILSRSIDGKNFFTSKKKFLQINNQPYYDNKLRKYGNPGPARGSSFDLWLWRDSAYSKNFFNIILPEYLNVFESSKKPDNSTWNNSEEEEVIDYRKKIKAIYF